MPRVSRFVVRDDLLYELATPLDPAVIADAVERLGSVEAAANELQLRPAVVQAAVDRLRAPPEAGGAGGDKPVEGLALVRDLLGLFGGIAVLVYLAGGAVLLARLSYAHLPIEAGFGQLPREFLISVGLSQVLLPALIVAGLYSLARAALSSGDEAPPTPADASAGRFRELLAVAAVTWWIVLFGLTVLVADLNGGGPEGSPDPVFWVFTLGVVIVLCVLLFALWKFSFGSARSFVLGVPIGAALATAATFRSAAEEAPGFWITTAVGLLLAVAVAAVLRDMYKRGRFLWRPGPRWLTLSLTYGFVTVVAATAIAATFPFLEARACTAAGFQENGALIGIGERIFLGEPRPADRRIASLPAADVEELFMGKNAGAALCDPRGPSAAIAATQHAQTAKGHRRAVDAALRDFTSASSPAAAGEPAGKLAAAAVAGGRAALAAADAADSVQAGFGGDPLSTEARALNAVGVSAIRRGHALQNALNDDVPETLPELAVAATRATRVAAVRTRHLANRALRVAREASSE